MSAALRRIAADIATLADELDAGEAPDEFAAFVIAARLDEQARAFRLGVHCSQQRKEAA